MYLYYKYILEYAQILITSVVRLMIFRIEGPSMPKRHHLCAYSVLNRYFHEYQRLMFQNPVVQHDKRVNITLLSYVIFEFWPLRQCWAVGPNSNLT